MTTEMSALVETRLAWHAAAEHLLAGDLWRVTARIGLRRTPGGFGQPEHTGADGSRRRLRIDGDALVVLAGDVERWIPIESLGQAARAVGTTLGAPESVYRPETVADAEANWRVDLAAAARLSHFFRCVDSALEQVRRRHADETPTIVQLWPEHFDLACSVGQVNLGGSPGDAAHPEPYWYVGPWSPRQGDFWNEPWGAGRSWSELGDVDAAVEFFDEGLRRARESQD